MSTTQDNTNTAQDSTAHNNRLSLQERADCLACSAWLDAVLRLGMLNAVLWLAIVLVRLRMPGIDPQMTILIISMATIMVCIERFYALRLQFDVQLFKHWGTHGLPLQALDQSLTRLGLRKDNSGQPARTLQDRLIGTRDLVRWYVLTVVIQLVLFGTLMVKRFICFS